MKGLKGMDVEIDVSKPPKGMPMGEPDEDDEDDDLEAKFAKEAFAALKEDDEEGFTSALRGFVKACVEKDEAGGYDDKE